MARVDSLPEGAKEVLQTGSVIEREFSYELLQRVTRLPKDELLSNLSVLKDSELLYERGIFPQSNYIFKHALTREVVYDSILTRRNKILHEVIGNAIEETYRDSLDVYYEALVGHYITGENYEKGAEYSRLAARRAEKTVSLNDAIDYAQKGVYCLDKLPMTNDVKKKLIDARTSLGLYNLQMNHVVEAKEAVDPIINLALESDYKRRLSQIYTIIGSYYDLVEEDPSESFKYFEDALKIAEELNDVASLFFVNFRLGDTLFNNCEFEKALYHWNRALNINEAANNLWGISTMKSGISHVYFYQGKINLAFDTSDEALRIAEESGDLNSKVVAYTYHGGSCYGKGFFEEAIKHSLKGVDFSERLNLPVMNAIAQTYLGNTYFEIEEYQKAKDHYGKAIWCLEHSGSYPSLKNWIKVCVARSKVMNNEKDIDLGSFYCYETENKMKILEGSMSRMIGKILLNIDVQHIIEAEDRIKKAIESDKKNDMMWELGMDYALYSELFRRKGDQSKAKENLNKAIEIFKECGADGWVEKYEKELAALS
jgi:tetratricopeptide (TPR) repeat protein